jgi:hypothetical protein
MTKLGYFKTNKISMQSLLRVEAISFVRTTARANFFIPFLSWHLTRIEIGQYIKVNPHEYLPQRLAVCHCIKTEETRFGIWKDIGKKLKLDCESYISHKMHLLPLRDNGIEVPAKWIMHL